MSALLMLAVGILLIWLLACGWCGYQLRLLRFFVVLFAGLALNTSWMVFGLDARPFEPHAMTAHAAATLYALSAFGIGYLIGRVVRHLRASRVDDLPPEIGGSV